MHIISNLHHHSAGQGLSPDIKDGKSSSHRDYSFRTGVRILCLSNSTSRDFAKNSLCEFACFELSDIKQEFIFLKPSLPC